MAERWWRCARCGLAWIHARLLATHLMKVHGEPRFDALAAPSVYHDGRTR